MHYPLLAAYSFYKKPSINTIDDIVEKDKPTVGYVELHVIEVSMGIMLMEDESYL